MTSPGQPPIWLRYGLDEASGRGGGRGGSMHLGGYAFREGELNWELHAFKGD